MSSKKIIMKVYVNKEERETIQAYAKKIGSKSASAFVRELVLKEIKYNSLSN